MKVEIEIDDKIYNMIKEEMAEPFGITVEVVIAAIITQGCIFATHGDEKEYQDIFRDPRMREQIEQAINRAEGE